CKITAEGVEFTGTLSHTSSGLLCQRWDAQEPHKHSYNSSFRFPELSVSLAENYCRNPSNNAKGPWCLTTDAQTNWEYCDVSFCAPYTGK
uniref:Kringle domain-containing protein n=1 Tax=Capitella teleta TaxID=283909 RepID=X1YZB8_CAPTE